MKTEISVELERRFHNLERWNKVLTWLVLSMLVSMVAMGCQSSDRTVFKSPSGDRQLVVSAEGLFFQDREGQIIGQLAPEKLRLSGFGRKVEIQTDGAGAGLTIFHQESVRVNLLSDGDETQFSFHDSSDGRRASLTTDLKATNFYIEEPGGASDVHLTCSDGVARVTQVPKPRD